MQISMEIRIFLDSDDGGSDDEREEVKYTFNEVQLHNKLSPLISICQTQPIIYKYFGI